VATKSFLVQNFFYFINTSAVNTVRVFRPGRSQQNAQWIWTYPLTAIRTVWSLQVSQCSYSVVSTILSVLLLTRNQGGIPRSSALPLACDDISGNKFSSFSFLFNLPVVLVYRIYNPHICNVHDVYRENAATDVHNLGLLRAAHPMFLIFTTEHLAIR
jgi:hypothetical protein